MEQFVVLLWRKKEQVAIDNVGVWLRKNLKVQTLRYTKGWGKGV